MAVQVKSMDRLVMSDSVAKKAQFGDWNIDVSAALRNQDGKGVSQSLCPQRRFVSLVQQVTPEAKAEFGQDLARYLRLVAPTQLLPSLGDVLSAVVIEEPCRVVIPRVRPTPAGVPDGELFVQGIAQKHFKVAQHLKKCGCHGTVPFVEGKSLFEVSPHRHSVWS
jgi:hypothetical protein